MSKEGPGARLVAPKIAAQDAQNITHQLAKIGGNLNQLAHHANQGSQIDPQALKDLQNEVQRVWQQLT
ncbi:plasmid mobilization relaxosome protein MobC [Lactiplantibacillus plantarum]|uniref:plasmid mobilization relaxosome protein MobC n=1 Tax=Lactiplantibacillus plantarum TaxID=1590 RepID=UPI00280A6CE6|nr:plasmid mobilization relaxosome protein MobC [Lactiplantibacillus plantarum]